MLRKLLTKMGVRYRINVKGFPGKPDILFRKYKTAIFVNGCFWHNHNCLEGRLPKSNVSFWKEKIQKNKLRDKLALEKLKRIGYRTEVIWTCEMNDTESLEKVLRNKSSWLANYEKN